MCLIWSVWKYVLNVALHLQPEFESYSLGASLSKNCLTVCTMSKSSRLEVSHSSEVAVLPAFSSGFCVHFLQRGEYEGWWGACQLFHSPCFCFSLSQYPTFIGFYCGNYVPRGPLAEQIAISTLSMWFGGRPTCLSHISLRDEISPAHRLAGLKFAGQRVHILLSHMHFGGLYQRRWWWPKGAYSALAASPWCLIDQRCWCLDCRAKNDRSCVEMPTFLMNPSATEWKTSTPRCFNKTRKPNRCLALMSVPPLPVKVTWLDLRSLSRPQEEINNHTVSTAVRKDCLFPQKHGSTYWVEEERNHWDLGDWSLLGLLEFSCSPRMPCIVGVRIMDKACILEIIWLLFTWDIDLALSWVKWHGSFHHVKVCCT